MQISLVAQLEKCDAQTDAASCSEHSVLYFGRGDDTVGNPYRAQISQFKLFKLILLLKLDKLFPVEQFEETVSQSTVPSHPSYSILCYVKSSSRAKVHAGLARRCGRDGAHHGAW